MSSSLWPTWKTIEKLSTIEKKMLAMNILEEYTVDEVARLLGYHSKTIRRLCLRLSISFRGYYSLADSWTNFRTLEAVWKVVKGVKGINWR